MAVSVLDTYLVYMLEALQRLLGMSSNETASYERLFFFSQSMRTILDDVAPLKRKVISQKRLAPWYNSQLHAKKQTARKLERQWRSSNLEDSQLV